MTQNDVLVTLDDLQARYTGRSSLLSTLHAQWNTFPSPFIHIYDPTTTSQTSSVLSSLLAVNKDQILASHVDCTEAITQKLLFDRILNDIAGWTPSWENGGSNWTSTLGEQGEKYVDNFDGFLHALQTLYKAKCPVEEKKGAIIVLSHAERLRDSLPSLVTPLARLADLTNMSIGVIFLSHLPWEEVRPQLGSSVTPYTIALEPLSKEDVLATLRYSFVSKTDETSINPFHPILASLYQTFISLLYSILSPSSSSLSDLQYVAALWWPLYISPVLNDWSDFNDRGEEYELPAGGAARLSGMWRRSINQSIEGLVSRSISVQEYLEGIKDEEWDMRLTQVGTNLTQSALSSPTKAQVNGNSNGLQASSKPTAEEDIKSSLSSLPISAKYLLVASYLASFNPPKIDARILSSARDPNGKKLRKATGPKKRKEGQALKIGHFLSGPATFGQDRLWAISGALMEVYGNHTEKEDKPPWDLKDARAGSFSEKEVSRIGFVGQIEELIARRLLVRTSVQEKLEIQGQYRCLVSMAQAEVLAGELGFKLGPLLYEEGV